MIYRSLVHHLSPLAAALWHAERGLPVFPVHWNKKPLTKHGYKDASRDPDQIRRWWGQWPFALIGTPTGALTGLLVVDIDMKHGVDGERAWNALMVKLGGYEPATRIVTTPSGGRHIYLRNPDLGEPIRNSAGKLGPGIDIRANGGSIILPGSRLDSGVYELVADREPADCPEWLATVLRLLKDLPPPSTPVKLAVPSSNPDHRRAWAQAALDAERKAVAAAAPGTRNHQLNRSAYAIGQIVGAGLLPESEASEALWVAALESGLETSEINTLVSGLKAGMACPRHPAEERS